MKVVVICSNVIAIPTIQLLLGRYEIAGIVVPEYQKETLGVVQSIVKGMPIAVIPVTSANMDTQLKAWFKDTQPDIALVATFPFKIREILRSIPHYGFLNLHFGLLPEMRGPDPVFESIRQRKSTAGVTIHVMDDSFDTGPIVARREFPLPPHFTYGMLSSKLAYIGAEMADATLKEVENIKSVNALPQDETTGYYYPALNSQQLTIDWTTMDSERIIALVNSMNPICKSGTPTSINGWGIGICYATRVNLTGDTRGYTPGKILTVDQQNGLLIYAIDQVAIKAETIYAAEGYFPGYLLAGFGIQPGMKFGT